MLNYITESILTRGLTRKLLTFFVVLATPFLLMGAAMPEDPVPETAVDGIPIGTDVVEFVIVQAVGKDKQSEAQAEAPEEAVTEAARESTETEELPKPDKNTEPEEPAEPETATEPEGFVYSGEIPLSRELQAHTYEKCRERGLEYELVLAIMWRESRFTADAVHYNRNGTRDNGIMQINDVNRGWLKKEFGITDLMDPFQNIDAGTAMLGKLKEKYGEHNAMLAYQYGEGGMARRLRRGQYTSAAVEKAYSQREFYKEMLNPA